MEENQIILKNPFLKLVFFANIKTIENERKKTIPPPISSWKLLTEIDGMAFV